MSKPKDERVEKDQSLLTKKRGNGKRYAGWSLFLIVKVMLRRFWVGWESGKSVVDVLPNIGSKAMCGMDFLAALGPLSTF